MGEEVANSVSHGIGTLLSIAGLVLLIVWAAGSGTGWQIVSFSIFGGTLILLYLASTLYHSLPMPRVKQTLKIFFISKFRKISVALYVFMGWLAIIAFKEIFAHIPALSLTLLILGGVSYTAGLTFYAWRRLPYHHAAWHIFVIGGSIFHYLAVWYTL
jgi:hemolysin III